MTNIFKKIISGCLRENKEKINQVPYSNNFYEMDIIGNKRTGFQIEDWTGPAFSKMINADGSNIKSGELPNNGRGYVFTFDELLSNNNLPKKLPELGYFNLFKSSKVTDFISGSFLSQYGIIVSKKVKEIMEEFNIGVHRFYPIKLEQKDQFYSDYFLFKTLAKSDEYINIENSSFSYYKPKFEFELKSLIDIDFKNQQEIDLFLSKSKDKDYNESEFICAKELMLNESFPKYDLFYSNKFNHESDSRYPIVSERLKNALNETSGIEFKSTNRIKCCC